mmetsp:Transcript_18306/g.32905  ORF Transcript_18306/g.32905 Transcript_18306/m.32905 type:complete len:108 (-) Transcript_18306:553-876(-)
MTESEGWIKVKLKHRLWAYADLEVVTRTGMTIYFIKRYIAERYGRVDEIEVFVGDPNVEYSKVRDDTAKLGELLQTFGAPNKDQAQAYLIHYDIVPFNSTEPLLLAL